MLEAQRKSQKYNHFNEKIKEANVPVPTYRETLLLDSPSYTLKQLQDEIRSFASKFGLTPNDVWIGSRMHYEDSSLYLELTRPETPAEKEKRLDKKQKQKELKQRAASEQEQRERAMYEQLKAKFESK
jgi:hypothetical protein